ncbi:MAG: hypothetical protein M3P83_11900 [Actinomycetota bacterium]|nr:hypothetical protein [Actinomycetota bacterium]
MTPTLALLGSPLLGASVWERVAAELGRRGWPVLTAPHGPATARTPDEVLGAFCAAVPRNRPVVLVPHSNAGLYVPALVRRLRPAGAVFVDAGLPPAAGEVPLAPPELLRVLAAKADPAGLLPPWTRWWDDADVAALFPDPDTRARVERDQPRLPLSYFAARLPVPSGWDGGLRGAYLAFGDTYADDRESARARGWPTATLPGRHLHMLVDPTGVTGELQRLLAQIGRPGGR